MRKLVDFLPVIGFIALLIILAFVWFSPKGYIAKKPEPYGITK